MAVIVTGLRIDITREVGGIGSSAANPYRFADLMAAAPNIIESIAVHRVTRKMYYIPYAIWIGDNTYFESNYETVLFGDDVDHLVSRINITDSGVLNMTSSIWRCNVSEFSVLNNVTATDCAFYDFRRLAFTANCTLIRCKFVNIGDTFWSSVTNATNSVTDSVVSGNFYGNIPRNNIVDVRNKIINCNTGLLIGFNTTAPVKIFGTQLIDCTFDFRLFPLSINNHPVRVVDGLVDPTKSIISSTLADRATTLELATTLSFVLGNGAGALITVKDKDDITKFEDVYSEGATEELVYYDRYVLASSVNNVAEIDTITTYEPFTITITKEGYQDLTISGVTVTPGEPTLIRGELVEVEPPVYVDRRMKGVLRQARIKGVIKRLKLKGVINIIGP